MRSQFEQRLRQIDQKPMSQAADSNRLKPPDTKLWKRLIYRFDRHGAPTHKCKVFIWYRVLSTKCGRSFLGENLVHIA